MSDQPLLAAKIDMSKVDESKLFIGKNGARYLDVILMPSKNSNYGDSHMIVQSVSKEDRLAGKRGAILGNAKILGGAAPKPAPKNDVYTHDKPDADKQGVDEDVPF